MKNNKYQNSINKLSNSLLKYAIKENVSLEDLDNKVDIIMDALGLKEEENKEETIKTEETSSVEEITNNETDKAEDTTDNEILEENKDEEVVEESLDVAQKRKYELLFQDSRAYATDLQELKSDFNIINGISFDTISEVINYLTQHNIVSYNGVNNIIINDNNKDRGLLYTSGWYDVSKN